MERISTSLFAAALARHVSETTIHGINRFIGGRRMIYIKIIWFAAVILSLVYCSMKIASAFRRYESKEVATTIRSDAVDFEFPDLYFCNMRPISGSFSVTLGRQDAELLSRYRRMVHDSLASRMKDADPKTRVDNHAIRLINTLPKQFLFDKMGHRKEQSIMAYYFYGKSTINSVTFRHPLFLNCFYIKFTETELAALRKPTNGISVVLFLDPPLPPPFDKSTEQDLFPLSNGAVFNLKPIDWDSDYGVDLMVPAGWLLFLVPRGQYPSELSTQVSLGPGLKHNILVSMKDTIYNELDFPRECDSDLEKSGYFVDPYSGNIQTFANSIEVCISREISRLSQERYNCSVWKIPTVWEYRWLPSCFNISNYANYKDLIYTEEFDIERTELWDQAREVCESRKPCRSRDYSYSVSTSEWPSERDWRDNIRPFVNSWQEDSSSKPGVSYLLLNSTAFSWVRQSILQVELFAKSRKSQEAVLSLAYSFDSLIADFGGLLGLFLGTSLLSMLEILEFLHDCVLAIGSCFCWGSGTESKIEEGKEDEGPNVGIEESELGIERQFRR